VERVAPFIVWAVEHLPSQIVMSVEDLVDAALTGLDLGELITVPSLPDYDDMKVYEAARQKLIPNLSRSKPAERYRDHQLPSV
jgi:uncharacterized protein